MKTKNFIPAITLLISFGFMGCEKEDANTNNENGLYEYNLKSAKGPLLKDEVQETMKDIGAQRVSSGGITLQLDQNTYKYSEVIIYYNKDNSMYYQVYVWDHPDSEGFDNAADNECTKVWTNDGDCINSGTDCEVDYVDGEFYIICCDDPVV